MAIASEALRVVRVSERVPPLPGGKEIHVRELTREQVRAGDEVHLIYRLGDGGSFPCPSHQVTFWGGFERLAGAATALLFSFAAALRVLRVRHVDVVHLHGDFLEVPALAVAARLRGARLVVTVHGGLNAKYVRSARMCLRWADGFIALGDVVARDLEVRGVPRDRITVMSSGLNTDLLDSVDSVSPPVTGLIVAVGTLDPVKNYELAIRCVLGLPEELPVRLEILGGGPDLERLCDIAGQSPRIVFRGRVDRRAVYEAVSRAQLFVIASRSTGTKAEGVPTALLEAMYLRRHCLVSVHALPEPVVTDAESYESFAVDDESELSDLIARAVTDPERSVEIGCRGRSAVENLDWHTVAGRVRAVLLPATRATS